ncbi:autotransporter outer membrane beta-barrel domain-containing protein [Microvirga alba]|uniref:Autotransporter domain-containing protein n=1 Tax=Microvirga alba TaxID=2791025 RepID=A0A931BNN1_9HYPH|nr:autotransporter outer membrane beta-barrel domain-containing protein [Microvirga alba]MBF9232605.1 hypothetical protein [Microvirga alba]
MKRISASQVAARGIATMLLGGTSVLAMSAATIDASAADGAISVISQGANGKDGTSPPWYWPWASWDYPTAGASGTALEYRNPFPQGLRLRSSTSMILLGSVGGTGGDGKSVDQERGPPLRQTGGSGGDGGTVTFIQDGLYGRYATQLEGIGSSSYPTAAIRLYSEGGSGGYGMTTTGRGGQGGRVDLTLGDKGTTSSTPLLTIGTIGDNFAAAWVQSKGGKGGDGGSASQYNGGGLGGNVTATLGGAVSLSSAGRNAPVLVLQSIGGNGGSHDSQGLFYRPSIGGDGGTATLNLDGALLTSSGASSAGAVVQSVGGAGGTNSAIVGGAGGARGGIGGTAQATLSGTIRTTGTDSAGIVVQSVGGMGGHGGGGIFSGGSGGNAGNGGTAKIDAGGKIETSGKNSLGLVAQSVGGGKSASAFQGGLATAAGGSGGSGGSALSPFFSSGGTGGTGGIGGTVTVNNWGTVATSGEDATGILAQSIGGGGGAGGDAKAFGLMGAVALGGDGGSGARGGSVTVTNKALDASAAKGWVQTSGAYAAGIVAQSVGGGGGSGGDATAVSIGAHVAYARAVGGNGGEGATGGTVLVNNALDVTTGGMLASGLVAMSIGGGGGNGGSATAKATAVAIDPRFPTLTATHGIGGQGGKGNTGGKVTVANSAAVTTSGLASAGIMAMSVGGGGGNGGASLPLPTFSVAGLTSWLAGMRSGSVEFSVNSSVGGSGGSGGIGGTVEVVNNGSIVTNGQSSSGIVAMSVGGGGGNGGNATLTAASNVTFNDAVGGKGGSGNHGGLVTVTNQEGASITTAGVGSYAIHALSVGGGGGIGGGATASSSGSEWYSTHEASQTKSQLINVAKMALPQLKDVVAQYKDSNIAGKTGDAIVSFLAKQFGTTAEKAASNKGIFSRLKPSVPISLAWNSSVGGAGGASGNGGGTVEAPVSVSSGGTLTTFGNAASAIVVQSIGGGGGNGGSAAAGSGKFWSEKTAVGGSGGGGGNGGAVKAQVDQTGKITTAGNGSFGVLAQSIGGGGGLATTGRDLQAGEFVLSSVSTIGGSDGVSGNGNAVTVKHAGTIATVGNQAHGIVAQSVGGGGGIITDASYDLLGLIEIKKALGEAATIEMFEAIGIDIKDDLKRATALASKGGAAGSDSVRLGGERSNGSGGKVDLSISGTVATSGVNSFGVLAQSIGGGGGLVVDGASASRVNTAVLLGGANGNRGDGSAVTLQFEKGARIATTGDHASAVLAQSIGGGGGYGGSGVLLGTAQALVTGRGATHGDGGAVTIKTAGAGVKIETSGKAAHGIHAQSLGGGGGFVGTLMKDDPAARRFFDEVVYTSRPTNWAETYEDPPEAQRMASALYSEMTAALTKAGISKTEDDLIRQSRQEFNAMRAARGNSTGTGDRITMSLLGADIKTSGTNSFGIFAQSGFQDVSGILDPTRLGGNIAIDFSGTLSGGSGDGAAIAVDGGKLNAITIYSGSTVSALSGTAILTSFGSDNVMNHGTLIGDVNLSVRGSRADEVNTFDNLHGGTYRSAGTGVINLSAPGATKTSTFTNYGTFDIGGVGTIATASVTNGKTKLGGTLLVDVNGVAAAGTQANDVLKVSELVVEGVSVRPHAVEGLLASNSFRVVDATSTVVLRNAVSGASTASPISWTVSTGQNAITIAPSSASFVAKAVGDLTKTELSVLASLQAAWDGGNRGMAGTFADMANIATPEEYRRAIDSMTLSEGLGQPAAIQTLSNTKAHGYAMSCPAFVDGGTLMREGQCVWANVIGSRTSLFENRITDGFTQTAMSYRMGGQGEFSPGWFLGATASYNTSRLTTRDALSRIEGDSGDIAVALKRQMGPWLFAGALSLGYGSYDSTSTFDVGDTEWQALNKSDVWTAGMRLRGAYEFAFPNWYLRPYADLDLVHTHMPGYTLSGDGAVLRASDLRSWTSAFKPGVEIGARLDLGDASWLRPYASVGVTFNRGKGLRQNVSFSEGGGPGITFTSSSELPDRLLDLGAGVQFMAKDTYELRGEYKAQIGNDFLSQEFSLRAAMKF